jgi:hypothetical protein
MSIYMGSMYPLYSYIAHYEYIALLLYFLHHFIVSMVAYGALT